MARTKCWKQRPRTVVLALACAGLAVFAAACGKRHVRLPAPPPVVVPGEEIGVASWYGHPYHGRRTANGEVYDMEQLTAAHRTRPLGQWVRVENLGNGKTVDVRINDRGPFVDDRIIDLSRAAARAIGMLGTGTAVVRVSTISPPSSNSKTVPDSTASPARIEESDGQASYGVQVGAFAVFENAGRLRAEMEARYGIARLVRRDGKPVLWRVVVGKKDTREQAEALAAAIRAESGAAIVVRVDPKPAGPAP